MPERQDNALDNETLRFWRDQIQAAQKWSDDYRTKGRKIVKRFRDETNTSRIRSKYNILYSNTDTLLPVIYSEMPKADVRATNTKDLAARKAAEMIEQVIDYSNEEDDFNDIAQKFSKDYLLPGLGQSRVKVDSDFIQESVKVERDDDNNATNLPEDVEDEGQEEFEEDRVAFKNTSVEFVPWDSYIFPASSDWDDRPWEAFEGRHTYDEVAEMFGVEVAKSIEFDSIVDGAKKKDTPTEFKKATIYEIWDKEKRQQIFISKGGMIQTPIEVNDDPLELTQFYPTPKPLLSITTTDTTLPVPFFHMYQDQAEELDTITDRITTLVKELKRRGVYDSAMKELNRLARAKDNTFIPIKDYARFADKGGLSQVMANEDITVFAGVLGGLYNQRNEILNIIFQIVGISDIQRGVTDPRETAAAQRKKAHFGTLRVSRLQRDVQRFIRDLMRLKGELIINHFTPKMLSVITGMPLETKIVEGEVQEFGTIDLLAKVKGVTPPSIVIDIETDSTVAGDEQAERQDLLEFNTALVTFSEQAPLMQQVLGTDATGELLLDIVRKFKLGRTVQQAIIDQIEKLKAQEEQPQEPSAEVISAQAEMQNAQTKQQELQLKAAELQGKGQLEFAKIQLKDRELNIKEAELGLSNDIDQQKVDFDGLKVALEFQKAELDKEKLALEAQNPNKNIVAET